MTTPLPPGPPGRGRVQKPGLLVALALVLIVGGCLAISSAGETSGPTTGPTRPLEPVPATGGGGRPMVPEGSSAQPAMPSWVGVPTWTGPLRITTEGINMNRQPPGPGNVAYATVYWDASDRVLDTANSQPAAEWNETRDPTYFECLQVLSTQPLSKNESGAIPYRKGMGLCVETYGDDAIAFVRGVGEPGDESVQMRGIRWQAWQP